MGGRGGAHDRVGGGRLIVVIDDCEKFKCEYCGRTIHAKDACWDLHGHQ